MRITSLGIKRNLRNRFAYWLYTKWCNEPFAPDGKIKLKVIIGNPKCLGWDGRENHATLYFRPNKFVQGNHSLFIDKDKLEILNLATK